MSDTLRESVTDYVTARLNNKPIDRMHGEPTLVSYYLLVNQLAVKTTAVNTKQWGRKHGHLPLIINDAKFRTISGVTTATTDKTATPTGMDPAIDGQISNFQRQKLTIIWKVRIFDNAVKDETDAHTKDLIIKNVEDDYINNIKKEYTGYKNETTKTLLAHIKQKWVK